MARCGVRSVLPLQYPFGVPKAMISPWLRRCVSTPKVLRALASIVVMAGNLLDKGRPHADSQEMSSVGESWSRGWRRSEVTRTS